MATADRTMNSTFRALANRNYRWLWLGRLATSGTMQMGNVVQGWLVFQLTNSAFALGWVGAGWSVSSLVLGLYGGAICDRVDKRNLILWTRLAMMMSTLAIGLLVAFDAIRIWHLAGAAFLNGAISAFLMPAQQSIISDLVEPDTLMSAISMDAVGMGLMGIVGASLAGRLIDTVGAQSVYYMMAGLYVLSLFAALHLPHVEPNAASGTAIWADLKEGLAYLKSQPTITLILGLEIVRVLVAMPYVSLMPAFADQNLGLGASGLGLMQSAVGVGGLVASLIASQMGTLRRKGRLMILSSIVLGAALILYVTFPWLLGIYAALAAIGGMINLYMVLSSTLILTHTDPAFRGRVVSLSMFAFGLMPLGTIPAGAIADMVGVPWVVGVQGALVIGVYLLVRARKPQLIEMG
ncbi:MAG: MFS transporter [Chloroflexi bacterium]|nr:MFS transporter [Chloroflexota bacterium]